jgi:V8-like Glu-specific endopeptidase
MRGGPRATHPSSRDRAWGSRCGALAVATALLLTAAPAAHAEQNGVASHVVAASRAKAQRIKRYWTPARMERARPLSIHATAPARTPSRLRSRAPAGGEAVAIPPSPPEGQPRISAATPRPLAQLISTPTAYPYRTQGKLFGRDSSGAYECSATVVDTPTKRVIFTAGHCVYERKTGWANYVAFVPGYHNGIRPYGTFVGYKLFAAPGWVPNENSSFDIAAAVLRGTQPVASVVGARGIAWNQPRQENFVSYGYPAAYPFNGETLWSCPSSLGGLDRYTSAPMTQWITCNMTAGSSGGGWIIQGRYLNSINSYGYRGFPNRMYGPYFGSAAASLYNTVQYQTP